MKCFLCGTPGAVSESVGDGNRRLVACASTNCGKYLITDGAVKRLEAGGPNKEVLTELVKRAIEQTRVLDISVATDGLLETAEVCSAD